MAAGANDKQSSGLGPWLVKSGDRILGPYSTDDLSQLIREKEVVVIDEVMAPLKRWAYVRDVAAFQPVVEEIRRGLMHSREDTEVQGYTDRGSTPPGAQAAPVAPVKTSIEEDDDATQVTSGVETVTETLPNLGVTTPTTKQKPAAKAAVTPAAPATPKDEKKKSEPAPAAAKPAMAPLSHHNREAQAAAKDPLAAPKPLRRPRVSRAPVIIGTIVLIVAAVFIIYTVNKTPQSSPTAMNADNVSTQASVAWKRGEFDRALELYRSLNHDQPGQPLVAARLATLMMKQEGQTVEAKRLIESALPGAKSDDEKAELSIALGLASLANDDAKEAATNFSQGGTSWIASYDLGIAESLQKNWTEAERAFQKAGDNAVAYLMLARTHLAAAEAGAAAKPSARHEADEAIKKALVAAPDYQQESMMLNAYIQSVSGDKKRAAKLALEAVEVDPNQTADHFHDPSLALDQVAWSKLLPYCQALDKELNSRTSAALLGICLAKASQLEEASKLIDAEIVKDPNNAYLHAVDAYLHTLADRDDAARASLTLASKSGNSRLAQILNARLCMREKQDACAEDGWSKLASEPNPPIAAITGLAQLKEAKGDTATANALLVKAESMSPHYLPLLRLREDASR